MYKTLAIISTALIAALAPHAASAQNVEAEALFKRYVEVVNAGDKAGLRELISEDVERSPYRGCTPQLSNRDCLLAYIVNTVIDKHGKIKETESFGIDGDTIYGGLELRSDVVRDAGSERAFGIDKIKFKNNKIMGLVFLPNLSDAQTKKFFDHIRASGVPSSQPYVNRDR